MIVLLAASAIYLTGLQAGINAPRDAFTQCLKQVESKAESAKIPGDKIEDYIRTNCSSQIDAFKAASIAFDVKNGISRKEATSGADDMITGWLSDSVESYKFQNPGEAPKPKPAAAPAQPQPGQTTPQ